MFGVVYFVFRQFSCKKYTNENVVNFKLNKRIENV